VSPRPRTLLRVAVVALAAAALVPLLGVDPAMLALLLDADFLALAGVVGLTMLGTDVRVLGSRISRSLPVLWFRVGVSLTAARCPGLDPARSGYTSERGAREGS
jgi:hypothetical protein